MAMLLLNASESTLMREVNTLAAWIGTQGWHNDIYRERRNSWKQFQLCVDAQVHVHDSYNFLKKLYLKYKQFSICKDVRAQTE